MSLRLIVLLLVGLAAAGCDRQKTDQPQAPAAESAAATDGGKGIDRSHHGESAPAVRFKDPGGADIDLASFKGVPVLVNLWASWCGPCIKELPTLETLAGDSSSKLKVIAISQDNGPQGSVDAFLKSKTIGRFAAYHDKDMALSGALGVQVLPTTLLFGSDGKEVWRFTGDLDWTSAEARTMLAEAK